MKTGIVVSIPLTILFKKYHCHTCGTRLERRKLTSLYTPAHPDYYAVKEQVYDQTTFGTGDLSVTEYRLFCPVCQTTITLDEYRSQRKSSSQFQNDFAPTAELARRPSPAGKGDRKAVDEENE